MPRFAALTTRAPFLSSTHGSIDGDPHQCFSFYAVLPTPARIPGSAWETETHTLRATQPLKIVERAGAYHCRCLESLDKKEQAVLCAAAFFYIELGQWKSHAHKACTRPNANEEGERGGYFRDPFMIQIQ